jgi:hypothetical protein
VRLQLPARRALAAAAATAVWLAKGLTGSGTNVHAGLWLLLGRHVYSSLQFQACCVIHSVSALLVHVMDGKV